MNRRFFAEHQGLVKYGLPLLAFVIGLLLPSPIFRHKPQKPKGWGQDAVIELANTTGMKMAGGATYTGSIIKGTRTRHGFGQLTTAEGAVYEGEWKHDMLSYGTRTNKSSVYSGHFDAELNLSGFGIINYTPEYIEGKRKQGLSPAEITTSYTGNWHKNSKQGLGRSVKSDGSMEFGRYAEGLLQRPEGAAYRTGGSVYGIDVSHHQANINWDQLALYCDAKGNVFASKPKETTYVQPVFFAYMKATEGATYKDDTYSVRAVEAERHGIAKGAYHFMHMTSDVDAQVKNFLETVNWNQGDMPPALDVEVESELKAVGAEQSRQMVLRWLEQVEQALGTQPIIYTREKIREQYLTDRRFRKYDFWIARYHPDGPANFDWHLWQLTEQGRMSGHSGNVDINLFKGDYEAFRKYLNEE